MTLTPSDRLPEPAADVLLPTEPLAPSAGGRSPLRMAWDRFKRDRTAVAAGVVIVLLIAMAVFAPLLTFLDGHPPDATYSAALNAGLGGLPNGHLGGISGRFWLGVEPGTGRDLFSRIAYGARISLFISITATLATTVIAVGLGMAAGYFRGVVDTVISRLMDVMLAFPALIFMIALVAVVPAIPRIPLLIIILSFFGWPYLGRIVRGLTLSLREKEFVEAARSLGARDLYMIGHELLPNLAAPVIVTAMLTIPGYILAESGLSFLGLGVQPPTSSWGQMLAASLNWYATDPMYFIVPGFFLFVTVLGFNILGDGLERALNPQGTR